MIKLGDTGKMNRGVLENLRIGMTQLREKWTISKIFPPFSAKLMFFFN